MLFRAAFLDGIKAGEVTLAFRRWRKPTVKAGGRLRTAIGELAIDSVAPCGAGDITESDARAAGFADRGALIAELDQRSEGELYRIAFHLAGADSRIALRAAADLSADDVAALRLRLDRLDRSAQQAWTRPVLRHIADHEGCAAREIAEAFGVDRLALKRNIRKLKDLGLTESLDTGYRLSPRGRALLDAPG